MGISSLLPGEASFCLAGPCRIPPGHHDRRVSAKVANPLPGVFAYRLCHCTRARRTHQKRPAIETELLSNQSSSIRLSGQARPDLVHQPIHAEQRMGIEVGALVTAALLTTLELADPVVTRETHIEDGHI